MKNKILVGLVLCIGIFAVSLVSCSKDDDVDMPMSVSGTSWKVVGESDDSLSGVVLTFEEGGELKMSRAVSGWKSPKWEWKTGKNGSGNTIYGLTITMDDGMYLWGHFNFILNYSVSGSKTTTTYDSAIYQYGWYENDINVPTVLHNLYLEKL